jgi:predicted ArsR family transcriptional regulator
MTLKEAILDYLQVCGTGSSLEISEVLEVNVVMVRREVKRLTREGQIVQKGRVNPHYELKFKPLTVESRPSSAVVV